MSTRNHAKIMNNPIQFTLDYFIDKFEAIPEDQIGMGQLSQHCGLWHAGTRYENEASNQGYKYTDEAKCLMALFGDTSFVHHINDNQRLGGTPKSRILDALKALKEKELAETAAVVKVS